MTDQIETVATIASYARRAGDNVVLVLHLPETDRVDGPAVGLRLRGPHGQVTAPADVTHAGGGVTLRACVPARDLEPGTYRIACCSAPGEEYRRVQARLLVGAERPIALLPGPAPRSRMAPPRPSPARAGRPRAVRVAATAVDSLLRRLPEERAARYRASLRKAVRRVTPRG